MNLKSIGTGFEGIDGPYLIEDRVYYVDSDNEVSSFPQKDMNFVRVNNADKDEFSFSLINQHNIQPSKYEMPDKIIAVSDIEGNFNALSSLLLKNEVIDEEFNWTFGENHIVVVGDILDRDKNVMPVVWLLYKLEKQAEKENGKVHVLLGNHEIMNIQAKWQYAADKYRAFAQYLAEKTGESLLDIKLKLYSELTEAGRWLRSKNVVEKIGDFLFVHAGLHPDILSFQLSLEEINTIVRNNIDNDLYHYPSNDPRANYLMSKNGPYWYRGYVMDYIHYNKINSTDLDAILKQYDSKRQIIGHTHVSHVSTDYAGRVVRIDVRHGSEKYSKKTRGLLIKKDDFYEVDGSGEKMRVLK